MSEFNWIGKSLIFFGIVFIFVGLVFIMVNLPGGHPCRLNYIGRLPGDICIHKKNFTFFFPLTTSILISLILSLVFYLFSKK